MSNEDLEKLADLVVDKLLAKQKEMEDEYMQSVIDEQQEHMNSEEYEVKHFYTLNSNAKKEKSDSEKIEDLRVALKDAIIKEDYLRAADIQDNIAKLEDKGTA